MVGEQLEDVVDRSAEGLVEVDSSHAQRKVLPSPR
jgi:hypothetical protein